jgi:ectoine hydroxylase-related dioxygenase (phytanoyl-CoA dioxygenase family)
MRRIFNDEGLEKKFQKDGYVSVPFITAEEVAALTQIFYDTLPESGGQITGAEIGDGNNEHLISYDFTFIDRNPEYKRKVFHLITKYFGPRMEKLLADYRPIIANYIRKQPDTGEVPLHQNWAFADERKCTTVSIWCPLVESTVENGTLQVVPGSHKKFGEIRGPMVPWELESIKGEIIDKYLVPLETKAGDCVVLDDSIIHYSAVNKTGGLRLAIQLICIPSEVSSWHYFMNPSVSQTKVEVLEADVEFYMQFNPWKIPEGLHVVNTIDYVHKNIDSQEFRNRLKGSRFDQDAPKNFMSKLKRILMPS